MSVSLEHKTVRPGNLVGYNYYHSNRSSDDEIFVEAKRPLKRARKLSILLIALILVFVALAVRVNNTSASNLNNPIALPATTGVAKTSNPCTTNTLSQEILVSISKRHLWACNYSKVLFNSPVVTGDSQYADTVTPTGTYQIYAKQTSVTLTGSDQISSWNDYVNYWMPFLNNQYGTYGLHDASWRTSNEFGNIAPNSANASHGCVELPTPTAKWLYNWSNVGTTVQINA